MAKDIKEWRLEKEESIAARRAHRIKQEVMLKYPCGCIWHWCPEPYAELCDKHTDIALSQDGR